MKIIELPRAIGIAYKPIRLAYLEHTATHNAEKILADTISKAFKAIHNSDDKDIKTSDKKTTNKLKKYLNGQQSY